MWFLVLRFWFFTSAARGRGKCRARSARSPRRLRDPGTPSRGKQLADMHPQLAPCSRRRPMDCAMTRLPLTLAGAKRDPRWGDRAASGRSRRRRAGADRAEAGALLHRVLPHEKSRKASCCCSRSTCSPEQVRSPLEPAACCRIRATAAHPRVTTRCARPATASSPHALAPHLTDLPSVVPQVSSSSRTRSSGVGDVGSTLRVLPWGRASPAGVIHHRLGGRAADDGAAAPPAGCRGRWRGGGGSGGCGAGQWRRGAGLKRLKTPNV